MRGSLPIFLLGIFVIWNVCILSSGFRETSEWASFLGPINDSAVASALGEDMVGTLFPPRTSYLYPYMSSAIPKALGLLSATLQFSTASTTVAVELMSSFNAVTIENYSPQGPNVEGRVLVGGTFNVSTALPFNSIGNGDPVAAYANDFSFSGSGLLQVQNGGVVSPSGTLSASDFQFSGGGSLNSGASGQTEYDNLYSSLGISEAGLGAAMVSASIEWSQLTPTDVVVANGNNPIFNAGSGVAVFDIAASDVFALNFNPQFTKQDDTTAILINVSGENINNTGLGQNLDNIPEDLRELIVWNFYEAETLELSKFGGAIFAPDADAVVAAPNGSVVSKTLEHDSLHQDLFVGVDPSLVVIPEPGSSWVLLMAGGGVMARRRRS